MKTASPRFALAVSCLVLGCQPYRKCDAVDEVTTGELPSRLSATGLYESEVGGALSPGVRRFRPRFELWSDGSTKQRFISLPPGTTIDTSDMNAWQFPVGTKIWKEFSRASARIETRLLQRSAAGWRGVAYVWSQDGTDADAAPYGAIDALGTEHDVPAANECGACHAGRSSYVLGFSAVQLAAQAEPGGLALEQLIQQNLVSHAPATAPGVTGNELEQAALGYLHANCSHCHNASRPPTSGSRCFDPDDDLDFFLDAERQEVSETGAYRTTGEVVAPGRPDHSSLLELVGQRSRFKQMPPLATDVVDAEAVALLRRWIEAM